MITESAREFFVNGYQCEIRYERREHYTGWLEGEKIASSHNTSHIRQELINDAKWRVEKEPDFWKVCRAVHNFVEAQSDRDGEPVWVYRDTVINKVTPLEDVGPAYSALLELESFGLVEKGQIAMDLNVEEMFRAIPEEELDYEDELPDDRWG